MEFSFAARGDELRVSDESDGVYFVLGDATSVAFTSTVSDGDPANPVFPVARATLGPRDPEDTCVCTAER